MKLTEAKLDRMVWLANRRSRAKSRAGSDWPDATNSIEISLVNEMRPHLVQILRLARLGLKGKNKR